MKQILLLLTKMNEFTASINALIKTVPQKATVVENTAKLEGMDKSAVMSAAATVLETHINNLNNPHKVTLASLGGATTTYVDNALATTVSLAELPISQFGDTTTNSLGITSIGWMLKFNISIQAYIQGVLGLLPPTNFDLTSIDPSPANMTFHVYLGLEEGIPGYRVLLDKLPETDSTMYIGSVFTDDTHITSNSIDRVTRVGTYRLSNTAKGSAVSVTEGEFGKSARLDLSWTTDPAVSRYVAYDTLVPPLPFIAVTDDGRGKVVYSGGVDRFFNRAAPAEGTTQFSQLDATFKYLYNSINWVADRTKIAAGKNKILLIGDKAPYPYSVKTTGPEGFFTSFSRLLDMMDFDYTIKDVSDYGAAKLDVTMEELEDYAVVIMMSTSTTAVAPITEQCISNLVAYRYNGGGIVVLADHGPILATLEDAKNANHPTFYNTANKLVTRFGAWFSGNYNRSPINVGFLRTTYGDHPLYNGMLDTDSIYAGPSEPCVFISESR